MALLLAHERESSPKSGENSPKSGETSPFKRTRSNSPVDLTTVISLKEIATIADAGNLNKVKLLQRTMGKLYGVRERAVFTYGAHFERSAMSAEEADAREDRGEPGVERLRKRAEASQKAGRQWQALYDKATELRNESLTKQIDDATFDARVDALYEEEMQCRLLPLTDDEAYKISQAKLNAHWYSGEKEKVKSLGYDSSSMPDK
jgi:hypothetical protein